MPTDIAATKIWRDVEDMPNLLAETLDKADGFDDVVAMLTRDEVERIVCSGNGASYYVAHALWLASLDRSSCGKEVIAVPGGLIARGAFHWRSGDLLLAISSSGEFRDVIEAIADEGFPKPFATVTATPNSTIGQSAGARAVVANPSQRAVTHTQAFCGAILACLEIWGRACGDAGLRRAAAEASDACARAIAATVEWWPVLDEVDTPMASITYGTGVAWAAALENALLIKEVAQIPCEGVETREGSTAAMTALLPGHLVLSLPTGHDNDPLLAEADALCRSLGATVVRAPGGSGEDRCLSPITTFPAALALSVDLALRGDRNPDHPAWIGTYYRTARVDRVPEASG